MQTNENILTDAMIEEWKRDFESMPLFEQHMASARAAIERGKERDRELVEQTGSEAKTKLSQKRYLGVSIAAALLVALLVVWQGLPGPQNDREIVQLKWEVTPSGVRDHGPDSQILREANVVIVFLRAQFDIRITRPRAGVRTVVSLEDDLRLTVRSYPANKPIGPFFLARRESRVFFIIVSEKSFPSLEQALSGVSGADEVHERFEKFIEHSNITWSGVQKIIVKTREPR